MNEFITSYSGATFEICYNRVIKHCRNLSQSGMMQLMHKTQCGLLTPHVFSIGNNHIEMEYIKDAQPLAIWLDTCTNKKLIESTIDIIVNYIVLNRTLVNCCYTIDILMEKINHVKTRLSLYEDIELAEKFQHKIASQAGYVFYEIGAYHGDLTFTNILIDKKNNLYLIDFLPGYVQSIELDIVKLQQEITLQWSKHFYPTLGDGYYYACEYMQGLITAQLFKPSWICECMNYLRILPYAKDPAVSTQLRREIRKLIYT